MVLLGPGGTMAIGGWEGWAEGDIWGEPIPGGWE